MRNRFLAFRECVLSVSIVLEDVVFCWLLLGVFPKLLLQHLTKVLFCLLLLPFHSSFAFLAISLGLTTFVEIFAYVTGLFFFLSNHRGSHILSSWMVNAGCVFVAGIHRSRV